MWSIIMLEHDVKKLLEGVRVHKDVLLQGDLVDEVHGSTA